MNSEGHNSRGDAQFQEHLSLGLHALAQPLAILRAKLYVESISRMNADGLHQLAMDSAGQVERLCTLFNYLQELVLAERSEPKLEFISLRSLLEQIVDGVDLWFQDAGLTLDVDLPIGSAMITVDAQKISQAISSIALLAHGLSKHSDRITIATELGGDSTHIVLENLGADISSLNAESRLAVALVETNIRKQGGTLAYSLQPVRFDICVPNEPITT